MKPITKNTLFYSDNLIILREHISDESVDLIYLNPPFNSSHNYNVLFKDENETDSEARKARRKRLMAILLRAPGKKLNSPHTT